MYRDGDVEGKSPVVEHVYGEKHDGDVCPFAHGHFRGLEGEGGCDLGEGGCEGGEDELGEGDQETCMRLVWWFEGFVLMVVYEPLSASVLEERG